MAKAKMSNDKATPPPVSSNLWQRPKKWRNQSTVANKKTYSKATEVHSAPICRPQQKDQKIKTTKVRPIRNAVR